jgi:hypothetical protein
LHRERSGVPFNDEFELRDGPQMKKGAEAPFLAFRRCYMR